MRMLREHDKKTAAVVAAGEHAPVPRFEFRANAVSSYHFRLAVAIGVLLPSWKAEQVPHGKHPLDHPRPRTAVRTVPSRYRSNGPSPSAEFGLRPIATRMRP